MFFILRAGKNGSRWSGQETCSSRHCDRPLFLAERAAVVQVGFPGGHVEEGETDLSALARECKEEVGLNIKEPGQAFSTLPR